VGLTRAGSSGLHRQLPCGLLRVTWVSQAGGGRCRQGRPRTPRCPRHTPCQPWLQGGRRGSETCCFIARAWPGDASRVHALKWSSACMPQGTVGSTGRLPRCRPLLARLLLPTPSTARPPLCRLFPPGSLLQPHHRRTACQSLALRSRWRPRPRWALLRCMWGRRRCGPGCC